MILAHFINHKILQLRHTKQTLTHIRYIDHLQESFTELYVQDSLVNFFKVVSRWVRIIFSTEQYHLYLEHNGQLLTCDQQGSFLKFPISAGIAGYCLLTNKGLVSNKIMNDERFDERVDVATILPVHVLPITLKQDNSADIQTLGVIEVIRKRNFSFEQQKMETVGAGVKVPAIESNSFEVILSKFAKNLAQVILNLKKYYPAS